MAKNKLVAKIFYDIADMLELQGVQWKPRAYRKAALEIESLPEDVEAVYARGELEKIPGVGENIAKKIVEIIETGKLKYYEDLKKQLPINFEQLSTIAGIGPKKARVLYEKLGVRDIASLKKALRKHELRKLEGFGEKTEENISLALKQAEARKTNRVPLGFALADASQVVSGLKKACSQAIQQIEVAGSTRRMKETIRDIDVLVAVSNTPNAAANAKLVVNAFTSLPFVSRVLARGETKSSVVLESGLNCDLRVVELDAFGSALQYFTGSKDHNIKLRKIAIAKKLKLSEYGVFKRETNKRVAGRSEQEVYAALGLPFIEPELREDTGEVEAALSNKLPKLVGYNEVRGDLHVHSNYSDGSFSIKEMVEAAGRLGREYVAVTDHSPGLGVAHGLKEQALKKHALECARVEKETGIRVLHGSEVNIRLDGKLDYPNKVLKDFDFVVASVHSGFNLPKEKQTARVLRALDNEFVHALGHPTCRKINQRDGIELDLNAVFEKARENKVLLEINSWPERLDLRDVQAREAVGKGVTLVISTDAHSTQHLENMRLGIATARRGWVEQKNVANTLSFKDFERKWLKK